MRNTRIYYKWQQDRGKTVRGPSIVLMPWNIFQIASEVRVDNAQINMAYNRSHVNLCLLRSVFSPLGRLLDCTRLLTDRYIQLSYHTRDLWQEAVSHGKVCL